MKFAVTIFMALWVTGCLSFHPTTPPGAPKEATYIELEQARVRYVDEGQGPAVVLLHGFAASLDTWRGVMPALTPNHRVIALDLKGFGWSARPEGDYSPQMQAKLVLDLLKQRGVEEFAIVGHSWGSSVALQVALMAPERVKRIALYDAWVFAEQLPTFFWWARASGLGEILFGAFYNERPDEKMANAFYDPSIIDEAFVESVQNYLDRPGTRAAALSATRGQRFEEWQHEYRTIRQPTLLLWGREDAVTRLEFGERLSRELPNAKLVVYPRCGHFPMIEASAASTDDLVAFLAADANTVSSTASQADSSAPTVHKPNAEPELSAEPEPTSEVTP